MADNVTNYEEPIPVVKGCYVLKKLNECHEFVKMYKELGVRKSAIYFKIKIVKILGRYPKLKISSLFLNFIKDYPKNNKYV